VNGNHGIQRWNCAAEKQDQQQLIYCRIIMARLLQRLSLS
jgi:hypothetical protein